MLFKAVFALSLLVLAHGSDANCVNCTNCAVCTSREIYSPSVHIVTVDFSECKIDGDIISWGCCRGSLSSNQPSYCTLHYCDANLTDWDLSKNKCDETGIMSFLVPANSTDIVIQIHDGKLLGDTPCLIPGDCCGGSGTSCSTPTGVCEVTIPLDTCLFRGT